MAVPASLYPGYHFICERRHSHNSKLFMPQASYMLYFYRFSPIHRDC